MTLIVNVNVNELAFDRSDNINPHLGKISLQPHKFNMHAYFDSIHNKYETWYEISECIINVWDCAEILPSFVQSGILFSNYSMSAGWI